MSEPLPPPMHENWLAFCAECKGLGQLQSPILDGLIKLGMELAWYQLKPHLTAALPYFEAGVRDTRLKPADGSLVLALAAYTEIATYDK